MCNKGGQVETKNKTLAHVHFYNNRNVKWNYYELNYKNEMEIRNVITRK